jgi:hypothetical protein
LSSFGEYLNFDETTLLPVRFIMRTVSIIIVCIALTLSCIAMAQERGVTESRNNMRIQKIVHDVIGKTVTLNFKEGALREGTLTRADGSEFVLETDGAEEKYPTSAIRSLTIGPGVPEGILVVVSSVLVAGFGLGVATLSFEGVSSGVQTAVAAVFGLFGGWIGYESFFQPTEIELP